jgi:2,5-diketo-D-gluconate reductase B
MTPTIPVIKTPLIAMPKLGLGTWPMKGEECSGAVASAIELGYRHIDTAEMYGNEAEVGAGIRAGGVPRQDLFVTSKVWWEHLEPDAIERALDASLAKLGLDYLDLYLIHWPAKGMNLPAALQTMRRQQEAGKLRAIGVSNFPVALMQEVEAIGIPIAALQVEYHLKLSQKKLLDWCRPRDIVLTAYAPLGRRSMDDDALLARIAAKHGARPLQVALAWLLQQDLVAAIPKAAGRDKQQWNLEATQLVLDAEDLAALDALPKGQRQISPGFAPAWDRD